jgi:C4-dicarboxylate-specific signal transduction histidine kinase
MDSEFLAAKKTELEALANRLTHEVNNNLAVIKVKAYLLQKKSRAGSLRANDLEDNLESISAMSDRIAALIKQLRDCNQTIS